jgi:ABC-type sulfate transport system substrate-binding protein
MEQFSQNPAGIPKSTYHSSRRAFSFLLTIILIAIVVWFMRGLFRTPQPPTIVIYCFTGMQDVMENGIFPAFQEYWTEKTGEQVEYIPTFAGSGAIIDRIVSKVPLDVAVLASEMDALRLSERGLAAVKSWRDLPHLGVCCRTPLVMLVREGNPKGISGYDGLIAADVEIINPDPRSSGAGEWSLLAVYGSALRNGLNSQDAFLELGKVWRQTTIKPSSARYALQRYQEGSGDVLFSYESNILANRMRSRLSGQRVPVDRTILCEPIVLPLQRHASSAHGKLLDEFVHFFWSTQAQELFVAYGFHSVEDSLNLAREDFASFHDLFTVDSLGGASICRTEILDRFIQEYEFLRDESAIFP